MPKCNFNKVAKQFYLELFGVILVRIFPAFPRIQSVCGKNADQNNSEYYSALPVY